MCTPTVSVHTSYVCAHQRCLCTPDMCMHTSSACAHQLCACAPSYACAHQLCLRTLAMCVHTSGACTQGVTLSDQGGQTHRRTQGVMSMSSWDCKAESTGPKRKRGEGVKAPPSCFSPDSHPVLPSGCLSADGISSLCCWDQGPERRDWARLSRDMVTGSTSTRQAPGWAQRGVCISSWSVPNRPSPAGGGALCGLWLLPSFAVCTQLHSSPLMV